MDTKGLGYLERLIDEDWSAVLSLLPADIEDTARSTGAIVRKREVKGAADLLRLTMAYSLCEESLRSVSSWCKFSNMCNISDVAVLKRLKKCGNWLALLVTQKLAERLLLPQVRPNKLHLRIVDASVVCRPGAKGTDWRLHLSFDINRMSVDEVYATDCRCGETFRNFAVHPGDVFVGDRAYGERRGIRHVVSSGGDVMVRINWQNLPLLKEDGKPFDILENARALAENEAGEWSVMTAPIPREGIESVDGRVVVYRKSSQEVQREQQRLIKQYRKKGKTPDSRTLEAAGYVFVFTTLSNSVLSAEEVLEVYRFRWQIELEFKRLKGILGIDEMHARCDELCRTFLLTKLLAALLVEDLAYKLNAFSPWGYGRGAFGITGQGVWSSGQVAEAGGRCLL